MSSNNNNDINAVDKLLASAQSSYFDPDSKQKVQHAHDKLIDIIQTIHPQLELATDPVAAIVSEETKRLPHGPYTLRNANYLHLQSQIRLGRILEAQNLPLKALKHFKLALKHFPNSPQAHFHVAKALKVVAKSDADLQKCEHHLNESIRLAQDLKSLKDYVISQKPADRKPSDLTTIIYNPHLDTEIAHLFESKNALIFLLLQCARVSEAKPLLKECGYTYHLATCVLSYPFPPPRPGLMFRNDVPFLKAVDNVLHPKVLERLRHVFAPNSSFWTEHRYGPDTPYFSYLHPLSTTTTLSNKPPKTALDQLITYLHRTTCTLFPLARRAKYAEWWVHSRLHPYGHQLHFDSDDEGKSRTPTNHPRHPLLGSILFLEADIGGPTLITNQRLNDPLASHGWLVYPEPNRYVVFEGGVLHGVIPGRGVAPDPTKRRLTLMVAYWDEIEPKGAVKEGGKAWEWEVPGTARMFPYEDREGVTWPLLHKELFEEELVGELRREEWVDVVPIPVEEVWEDCEDEEESSSDDTSLQDGGQGDDEVARLEFGYSKSKIGLPQYDVCFQGF
ncbi:hypothetical protein HDV05_007632 [Chytridiales sp. JEL 0842]|nr:hypothetical protein HDV05_007632 [Chytridiales sp. JEL 0842]